MILNEINKDEMREGVSGRFAENRAGAGTRLLFLSPY